MLFYLKGVALALTVSITVMVMLRIFLFNYLETSFSDIFVMTLYGSMFAYTYGLVAVILLKITENNKENSKLRILLFLFSGALCGLLVEWWSGFVEFPILLIGTTLGAISFLLASKVNSKFIGWILAAVPFIFIFLWPIINQLNK